MRLMKNLKNISVKNVENISAIDNAIDNWQLDLNCKKEFNNLPQNQINKEKKIHYDDSFNIVGDQILLFEYLANGSEENNENILKLLNKEIKIKTNKDIPDEEMNEDHIMTIKIVNHLNIDGFTPLYFTCLNGHTKMVDLIIKNGGDHLMKCGVSNFFRFL